MTTIERIPVHSRNLASIGYDADERTLAIEFNSGHIYHYFDVPSRVHDALMASDSQGRAFRCLILGRYKYVRVH